MRRTEFEMDPAAARALLGELPVMHLASTLPDGTPVLRSLHGFVVEHTALSSGSAAGPAPVPPGGGWLAFHSAPKGEKTSLIGRPAVLMAEETVATVPSTFFDAEKACPATTYYRSVQVEGVIEEITEPAAKAAALQALMEKLQPEGGYVPITAEHPHYRAAVKGILIAGVRLERAGAISGKAKLAQNRRPAEVTRLLESLWRRGAPGDARALELIRAANPAAAPPGFLAAPPGTTLHAWLPDAAADEAAAMLVDEYWNVGVFTAAQLARAHRGASAWVGARDGDGRLIASARAIADGAKLAWIYDVIVHPAWRGHGLGKAVMRLLLDHPHVRDTRRLFLGTRDAQTLYEQFGFVDVEAAPPRPFPTTNMVLIR